MKKIKNFLLFLLIGFTSFGVINVRSTNNSSCAENNNINSLKEIARKYDANIIENDNSEYRETPHEEIPSGTPDYVNYQSKEYLRETTFNKNNYFQNLNAYSAENSMGSCGFVSLIQVMSFYDTFYNDTVIPEIYDYKYPDATTESEVKLKSPGVKREGFSPSEDYPKYYNYCHGTESNNLQSKLTILKNKRNGSDNNGTHTIDKIDEEGNEYKEVVDNFDPSIGGWSYQDVLNDFYSIYGGSVKVNSFDCKTQSTFIDVIKDTINSGNPIIVHIKRYDSLGNETGFHSVVAYDYDDAGIYANFGWGSDSTHSQLLGSPHGYSKITNAFTLDYSALGHTHSDNYVINGKGYCGCNISDELLFSVPMNWKNIPPTIYWMKDSFDANQTYTISFKNTYTGQPIVTYTTEKNQLTLSVNAWHSILDKCNGKIFVYFKRNSSITNYNSYIYTYDEPTPAMEHINLSPSEYGFEGRYYFENEGIKELPVVQGKYTIGTTRLRCGYIEQEYIVLSPRRANAGKAYLIYSFDCNVYRIDVDLTWWSKNEGFNDEAYLQYKDKNGKWVTIIDLAHDVTLSKDRNQPITYTVVFPEGVSEFMFYTTSLPTGDRNKGRICIGDMNIYLEDK